MPEPVLVVHGVANRDCNAFAETVADLERTLGGPWELIPVYWGDLGADADADVLDTLPVLPGQAVRADDEEIDASLIEFLLGSTGDGAQVREADQQVDVIVGGAAAARDVTAASAVRGEEGTEAIREGVRAELPQTRYLRYVRDPAVLDAVGRVLGQAASSAATGYEAGTVGDALVRGADDAVSPYDVDAAGGAETRVFGRITETTRALLHGLDDLVGRAVGDAAGRFNQEARRAVGQSAVGFFGDVFVYQRHRAAIHDLFWQAIDKWQRTSGWQGASFGTEQQPISVVGHSLGGVAAFDAAVAPADAARPLWIKSLVTFGSQSAFFHVVDRRTELPQYRHGQPVALPPRIGRWTNLWEPMDFLAFTAGAVFRLASGEMAGDVKVNNPLSLLVQRLGFTHSSYWKSEELVEALRSTLGP